MCAHIESDTSPAWPDGHPEETSSCGYKSRPGVSSIGFGPSTVLVGCARGGAIRAGCLCQNSRRPSHRAGLQPRPVRPDSVRSRFVFPRYPNGLAVSTSFLLIATLHPGGCMMSPGTKAPLAGEVASTSIFVRSTATWSLLAGVVSPSTTCRWPGVVRSRASWRCSPVVCPVGWLPARCPLGL